MQQRQEKSEKDIATVALKSAPKPRVRKHSLTTKKRVGRIMCGTIVCSRIPGPHGRKTLSSLTEDNGEIVDSTSIPATPFLVGWVLGRRCRILQH